MTKISFPHGFPTLFPLRFEDLCNISLENLDKFYLFPFSCAKAVSLLFYKALLDTTSVFSSELIIAYFVFFRNIYDN